MPSSKTKRLSDAKFRVLLQQACDAARVKRQQELRRLARLSKPPQLTKK